MPTRSDRLQVATYMTLDEVAQVDALANEDGRTRSDWVRRTLLDAIRERLK